MGENTEAEIRFSPVVQYSFHLDLTSSERKNYAFQEKLDTHGRPRTSSLPERTDDTASSFVVGSPTADAPGPGGTVGNDELEVESPPPELPPIPRESLHTSIKITLDTPALCGS
jgi:hypothetical protein